MNKDASIILNEIHTLAKLYCNNWSIELLLQWYWW